MTSYGYIITIIVDSCMIWFHLDCIMQLKKSYYIATHVCGRKSVTTFGDIPDWWMDLYKKKSNWSLVRWSKISSTRQRFIIGIWHNVQKQRKTPESHMVNVNQAKIRSDSLSVIPRPFWFLDHGSYQRVLRSHSKWESVECHADPRYPALWCCVVKVFVLWLGPLNGRYW